MARVTCPDCGGSGRKSAFYGGTHHVEDPNQPCRRCNGRGSTKASPPDVPYEDQWATKVARMRGPKRYLFDLFGGWWR